ncbi:MAG: DUF4082 domain-containing protein [Rhizomicrobium sp.]
MLRQRPSVFTDPGTRPLNRPEADDFHDLAATGSLFDGFVVTDPLTRVPLGDRSAVAELAFSPIAPAGGRALAWNRTVVNGPRRAASAILPFADPVAKRSGFLTEALSSVSSRALSAPGGPPSLPVTSSAPLLGTPIWGTTTHWTNSSGGDWNVPTNWSAGIPDDADHAVLNIGGSYAVTSTSNVDINSLAVASGVTLSSNPGTLFAISDDVINNGIIKAGPFSGEHISRVEIEGNVSGTGSFEISDNAVLEIEGSVSGKLMDGAFSGITVLFGTEHGELILDHSAQYHGLIAGSSPGAPLSAENLIDLKDLPFTSSMSASVHYDSNSNISTVDFGNGSTTVTLLFSGQDSNWILKSDGQGGTIVSDPVTNPIMLENQKPGTPKSVWQIEPGQDSTTIQGFTTAISSNVGGTVQFKINNQTGSPNYHIDIYRLGYYGGNGARLVTTLQNQAATSVVQPAPLRDPSTGLVDAGNWSVTDSWNVPTDAVSGVYVANVVDGAEIFQIPFVIRNDSSHSEIVLQTTDQDWQAYNGWGGANLYGGNGPGIEGSAYAVSYNRPIVTRDGIGSEAQVWSYLFSAEYPAIQWLEQNGYDVSYISGIDSATNGSLLLNHKVFMDAGHDEYWTETQRANVEAAAHAGVNLVFLSGNEIFWKTRLAPSIDGSGSSNRTLVSYKDTHANALIDPTGQDTGNFADPRFGPALPANQLTGTLFAVNAFRFDTITVPYPMTQLRFWRNTAVAQTSPGQTASLVPNLLGVEWDTAPDNGFRPAGLVNLSSTTVQVTSGQYLLDYGNTFGSGTAIHNLVLHRDPVSGALIFSAGSIDWSWALASDHDGMATPVDPNVQQAMVNLFADMGVQPATLQANLVTASQSTDATAPTSGITNLSATSVVEGQSITATGTATDAGGKIAGVEVSTDGGKSWHPANGNVGAANVTWSYTFVAGAPGTFNVESRATDDSLNLGAASTGVSYKVTPSSNLTIFSPTDTPAVITNNDSGSVELGVKFVPAESGQITGIRFYKGPQNTGTHLGDLWTSNGTLLASATFSNETASGWQQVNFATPVSVQGGVTYVASYHANTGHYSSTDFYFIDYGGHTTGALNAPGSSLNGLYAYGSGPNFPSNVSYIDAANYWVDVVFNDSGMTAPQARDDSGFTVTENGVLNIPASTLIANDTNPSGLAFSLTSVSNPVNGSVSYNSQSQTVTFTPAPGYAGAASFTYTITDTSGQSGSGQVSLKVNYPVSAQSLFGTNDTPAVANSGDTSPVELGVKFTASANGTITGLRFYKGSLNAGTHVADLWSSTGTLLATATFTSETASGWQQVSFSNPVAITAGTTYVASYHTNGNYSVTQNYFTTSVTNGQLTAPASGNGVFSYGSGSVFPTSSFKSTNYWLDVIFNGSSGADTPPTAVADAADAVEKGGVNNNTGGSAGTGNVLTNDTDPDAGDTKAVTAVNFGSTNGTLGSALAGAHGSLVLNASGAFTYTVNENDAAVQALRLSTNTLTDIFNYTMRDAAGATSSAALTITLHGANDAPALAIQTSNQTAVVGSAFSLALPAGTFTDVDSGDSLTYTATAADGSPLPAWLTFNASTRTFSGTPTSADVGTLSVRTLATDLGTLAANETFNISVTTTPSTVSLFSSSDTPAVLSASDTSQVNLGVKFISSAAGTITGIKYYKGANDTGTHTGSLWSSTGTLLASATFSNETSSGWQTVSFSNPVSITAGITYVASFHSNGHYTATGNYFTTAHTNGPLTAPASNNGVYTYGTGNLLPTSSFNATNYWVDVVFSNSGGSNQPPVAANDSGFNATQNTPLSIAASALLVNDTDPNGDALTITGVSGGVNGTASFDAQNNAVIFTPANGYTGPASFNYAISDGRGGTASASVSLNVNGPSSTTVSLFSSNPTPSIVSVNDPNSVELGMKFQSSAGGDITGLRFYKGPSNTGTHVADLWSSTGTLLATATFTNETASGWQLVNFATPVTISAGTTYIASYHTAGNYSADPNLFANSITNGPLTAPSSSSSGGNGVYGYGTGSLFPTNSFNSNSYGVDVVFRPQLAA